MFYFGCKNGAGHYAHDVRGNYLGRHWLNKLDGRTAPKRNRAELPQGHCSLSYTTGNDNDPPYTLVSFWDRSVDSRPGSNSIFAIPGELKFEEALVAINTNFQWVVSRFRFPLVLAEGE